MTDSLTSVSAAGGASRRWLIEAAQHGDRHAQEELIRRFEPLVQRAVWKLRLPPYCEREDLAQEARLGLLAAIRAWRPERGPFPAFADRCVTNQALLALQAACRHKQRILSRATSLEAAASSTNGADDRSAVSLLDVLAAPPDARTDPESRLLVREQLDSMLSALPTLTANEQAALAGTLNGRSYQQLAPALGGTPKAVSQAAYRARRKLAAALSRAA
jgi:RNA polymerase sporulation-specific sigma factor